MRGIYFPLLFGKNFIRHHDEPINVALNYGYAILLSTVNQEIICNGYITQLGIHHKNEFNPYNLACDLMEPFRIVIDDFVNQHQNQEFGLELKKGLVDLLNQTFIYNQKRYTLKDIIKQYTKNTLECLKGTKKYNHFLYEKR